MMASRCVAVNTLSGIAAIRKRDRIIVNALPLTITVLAQSDARTRRCGRSDAREDGQAFRGAACTRIRRLVEGAEAHPQRATKGAAYAKRHSLPEFT